MSFLMQKGTLYLPYNGNLLIHGCIPVDEDGEMESMSIDGVEHHGRDLLDTFESYVRYAFDHKEVGDDLATISFGISGQVNTLLSLVSVR